MGKNKRIPSPENTTPEELALIADAQKQQAEKEAIRLAQEEEVLNASKKRKEQSKQRKAKAMGMLDGSVLLRDGLLDHWRFILFCVGLAFLLIASNYFAESTAREISKIKKEMKELRTIEVSSKAELMSISIQSSVAVALDTLGIKESIVPPMKIMIPKPDQNNDSR
ncbi:MAG: FtsL-like putative cell division protein [Bacteroidales bacterium]